MTRSLLRTACTTTVLSVQLNLVVPGYYFETWYHFPISLVNSFEHWDLPGFPRPGYPYSNFFWNNSVLEPSNSCFIVNRYLLLGSSKNYSKYFWNIFACPESLPNFGICRYGSKIHHFFWNTVNFSTCRTRRLVRAFRKPHTKFSMRILLNLVVLLLNLVHCSLAFVIYLLPGTYWVARNTRGFSDGGIFFRCLL
eukprot:SAG11_NODE_1889_length_4112_cov_19.726888_1_plen_195_part_00